MNKESLIKTIYLYLFSLAGLILIVIGAVGIVKMGLKMYVFTQADEQQRISHMRPPTMPVKAPQIIAETQNGEPQKAKKQVKLTENEITTINNWIEDYKSWKEQKEEFDPVTSDRHRDASHNLAMILIGLPLYIYHWRIIRKT